MNGVEWFLEGAIRSKINMIYLFLFSGWKILMHICMLVGKKVE